MNRTVEIGYLYPELLNLYSDRGNVTALSKRLSWRGINPVVREYSLGDEIDFESLDIMFIGGGSDKELRLACDELKKSAEKIKEYAESGGCIVAVGGGYQLLGQYYCTSSEKVEGLSVLDIVTEYSPEKLMGDIMIANKHFDMPIVGFENHSTKTYIEGYNPLGKVVRGNGNNAEDGGEGVLYKNIVASYLHGPLLPKNPQLCDFILEKAISRRYGEDIMFPPLDNMAEECANTFIKDRLMGGHS